ncbi:MAG: STAS domain-containing protein [Candidatus Omnitrophica bacterium]|nr:STAS domain-containing protein [Candidatus Omnitrophota bacterium]
MKIRKTKEGNFIIISIEGEMDAYAAESFDLEAAGLLKDDKDVIVDFAKLQYISSSGLRAIISLREALGKAKKRLVLKSLKGKVLEVFRVSKLLDIFEIEEGA